MSLRKRSKNITEKDIETIVRLLDTWEKKLTWAYLIEEVKFKTKKHYTRQALSNYSRIQSTYSKAKIRISNKDHIEVSGGQKSANYLYQRNQVLIAENIRLINENEELLQQFARWSFNSYLKGLTIHDLNKSLPPIDRGADE